MNTPSRNDYRVHYFYKNGNVKKFDTRPDHTEFESLKADGWLYQASVQKDAYAAACRDFEKETNRLLKKFKDDALYDLGLTDNPKADLLFSKAWEHGHSSGLYEVFSWMEDLAELITNQ